MKIAIIAYNHPESSLVLAKYLACAGHAVDYYYITIVGQEEVSAFRFGVKALRPGITRIHKRQNPELYNYLQGESVSINLLTLLRASSKTAYFERLILRFSGGAIRRKKYDVINVIGQNDLLVDLHRALTGTCRVHSLHEVNAHYVGQETPDRLLAYLRKEGIAVITHSKYAEKQLANVQGRGQWGSITTIPFGVFETYKLFENQQPPVVPQPYILFYGFIKPYKGLRVLKQAVELMPDYLNFLVVVAGAGEDPVLPELQGNRRFHVINRSLDNEEIVNLNRHAHHIVCPYTSASQSGIIATSFLFGKPIIATDVGGFSESIVDGENGFLVKSANPQEFASKMVLLLRESTLHERMSARAFQYQSLCSWESIVTKYAKCFERLTKA